MCSVGYGIPELLECALLTSALCPELGLVFIFKTVFCSHTIGCNLLVVTSTGYMLLSHNDRLHFII